jgi:Tfp pilus assembly protein PilF
MPKQEQGSDILKTEIDSITAPIKLTSPNPYLQNPVAVPAAAQQKFQQANKALAAGDWQNAESDLLWLTTNHPALSGAFLNLALLYAETQQLEKAEQYFNQAISVNKLNVNAYNQYAIYWRKRGQFEQAEQLYLKALDVWPDYPAAHLNLGILYDLYMGALPPALEHYRLYQALLEEPSRQIQGWIMDAERRLQQLGASQ